jgi:protein TonB
MNSSSSHTQTVEDVRLLGTSELHSELARLCLPEAKREPYRRYAWANSLCAGVLIIGIIGMFPKRIVVREPPPLEEIVPVVYNPPPEQQKPEPQVLDKEPEPTDTPTEMPQVVAVVAANSKAIAFSVPVEGPVQIVPARAAPPPPPPGPRAEAPPKVGPPTAVVLKYNSHEGTTPWPTSYPREAQIHHETGTVGVSIQVDQEGQISEIVIKSSGHVSLDRHAREWIRQHWRFPPGPPRIYKFEFDYTLN